MYLAWTVFIANDSREDGMNKLMRTWNNVRLVGIGQARTEENLVHVKTALKNFADKFEKRERRCHQKMNIL